MRLKFASILINDIENKHDKVKQDHHWKRSKGFGRFVGRTAKNAEGRLPNHLAPGFGTARQG
eukprot:2108059-Ditylum_brightwellii.AAC.1